MKLSKSYCGQIIFTTTGPKRSLKKDRVFLICIRLSKDQGMSITSQHEFSGMKKASDAVALTLKQMREYATPGMSTKQLDEFGGKILSQYGAKSAPAVTYGFPGYTCISVNEQAAHGIPSSSVILKNGDLINIDVSAELDGFFADNGGSFVLGQDTQGHQKLVNASRTILHDALSKISGGVKIADIGLLIETRARQMGFTTIKNLVGHGIGRSLHEAPSEIPCFYDKSNTNRFRKNSIVAVETFISTRARYVYETGDGWTFSARDGSFVAQHEHTIMVTDGTPVILTQANEI
jgi:methionyl aminopeptidase